MSSVHPASDPLSTSSIFPIGSASEPQCMYASAPGAASGRSAHRSAHSSVVRWHLSTTALQFAPSQRRAGRERLRADVPYVAPELHIVYVLLVY